MARRKRVEIQDPFIREESFITDQGKTVVRGDIIKIKGVWGSKFKFLHHVTNPKNNVSWVDCIQLEKGVGCGWRSFYPERVKALPKKRGKRVKRTG
jgi:hypothetical protein